MAPRSASWFNPRLFVLVFGVALAVVLGAFAVLVLTPSSSASSPPPFWVYSHSGAVGMSSAGQVIGNVSVYSHAGTVGNGGLVPSVGTVSVYSHAAIVTSGPTTTTPSVRVLAGSVVYLFVGYVNSLVGGGYPSNITDTLGDSYVAVTSTGVPENHTESLYETGPIVENVTLNVSVTFAGGATTMGGSVALVDVAATSGVPTVDEFNTESGSGGIASVVINTAYVGDVLLFGVSGQQKDSPFVPGVNETLLDETNNTSGPFEDGESIGTFNATEVGSAALLSAVLAHPAVWNAIAVGLYATKSGSTPGLVTTPSVPVLANSRVCVFVGYVNNEIGGGDVASVTDTLGDSYTRIASTQFAENYTEDLYMSGVVDGGTLRVSVAFTGGDTVMGGAVTFVDLISSDGFPSIDAVATTSGPSGTTASVNLATTYANELLLLGVSGQRSDAPLSPGPNETLLETAANTSGPFEDAEGYGLFAAVEVGTRAVLSATLAESAVWNAIAVGLVGTRAPGFPGVVSTPTIQVRAGSLVCVFVGFVNSQIGGGFVSSVTDTRGDNYTAVASTLFQENHTETLYVAGPVATNSTLSVSVAFAGGDTTMGGAVAVVDVGAGGTTSLDSVATESGPAGSTAWVSFATPHANDFLLLGVSGQLKDTPFTPGPDETLLDTAGNTSGPFEDDEGYGTFSASESGSEANLTATLAHSAVWNAIGVGLYITPPPSSPSVVPVGSGLVASVAFGPAAIARRSS